MCPSRVSSEKCRGLPFCPLHLDFDDFEKQIQVKADFLGGFVKILFCQMQMIPQILGNYISRNTNGTDSEPASPRVREEQHFWRPGRRIKCWVVYFKIPAETVPSSKSCCAWKPSVQTSGFILALISTCLIYAWMLGNIGRSRWIADMLPTFLPLAVP